MVETRSTQRSGRGCSSMRNGTVPSCSLLMLQSSRSQNTSQTSSQNSLVSYNHESESDSPLLSTLVGGSSSTSSISTNSPPPPMNGTPPSSLQTLGSTIASPRRRGRPRKVVPVEDESPISPSETLEENFSRSSTVSSIGTPVFRNLEIVPPVEQPPAAIHPPPPVALPALPTPINVDDLPPIPWGPSY